MDHAKTSQRNFAIGVTAALFAALIWGSWIVITRLGVTTTMTPYDAAFLRFGIPAVVLLPVLLREGLAIRRIGILRTALMVAGSGLPFFLISSAGMQFAPAAHAGALLPGTMPLFVALLAALVERERFAGTRVAGFALIIAGVLAIGGYHLLLGEGGQWRGHLLFLGGACLWAIYTLAFRRAGIGAWHAAALINLYSIVAFLPIYSWTG
ncbi:MAG TPA: DMT family transporter, partial [Alphaproteobacteria bacterium]|nr:DMT family transporter [Alphaproteobacteria bacterium]